MLTLLNVERGSNSESWSSWLAPIPSSSPVAKGKKFNITLPKRGFERTTQQKWRWREQDLRRYADTWKEFSFLFNRFYSPLKGGIKRSGMLLWRETPRNLEKRHTFSCRSGLSVWSLKSKWRAVKFRLHFRFSFVRTHFRIRQPRLRFFDGVE